MLKPIECSQIRNQKEQNSGVRDTSVHFMTWLSQVIKDKFNSKRENISYMILMKLYYWKKQSCLADIFLSCFRLSKR